VLTGKQMNTLDSAWYGPISWISSLYLATLRAGSRMARESATITLRWGKANVQSVGLKPLEDVAATKVVVQLDGKPVAARLSKRDDRVTVTLDQPLTVKPDQTLTLQLL